MSDLGPGLHLLWPLLAQAEPGGVVDLWQRPELGAVLVSGYLALLSFMWVGLLLGVGRWGRRWVLPDPGEAREGPPLPPVSVCVPARDEAHQIGACVRALLASDLARHAASFEVVVVDDRSSDGTSEAARAADDGSGRLHVVAGTEPPAGWAGKPWACARAAGEARGTVLCFVDADVVVHPRGLRGLVQALREDQLSLVSAFGTDRKSVV